MDFEQSVPLEEIVKAAIEALPRWCKGLEGDFETHEWVSTYEHISGKEVWKNAKYPPKVTRMLPYYLCRHCHAVSSNFTTSPDIKRVR